MDSAPIRRNWSRGPVWECGMPCGEDLLPADAHGIWWCLSLTHKHAWKREGDAWVLAGTATYDRDEKWWGTPVAVEAGR